MELIDTTQMLRFAFALIFVLALMGGLALVVRKFGNKHPLTAPHKRRLKILEVLPLDGRRRAMILKRDNNEHLVILGPNGETVVETNIDSKNDKDDNTRN